MTASAIAAEAADRGGAAAQARALRAADFELSVARDLDAVKEDWLAFEQEAAATPFQSFRWMHAWRDAVSGRKSVSPLIVTGRRRGRIAFILPVAVERRRGVRRLVWFGHELADYNGPLIDPETLRRLPQSFVSDMLDYVRAQAPEIDHAYLTKQPETLIGLANPFARHASVPFTCDAHSARLEGDWESFSRAHRSTRSLRRLREKEKKLAGRGGYGFEQVDAGPERERLMDSLIAWKVDQLAARGDRVPFACPAIRKMVHEVARSANDPRFRLYALKSEDRAVALAFCLVAQGRLIYYLCAYEDGEAARHSPGLVLLVRIFQAAFDEGLEIFDFSNGDEAYKD
ncbi:MAG TPA: GNAT family N-acetyltransferase, partial [Hyphomicrobiales bacterium]|nr:GNAT family N-acetyltransferase [Hyphomicrobiales bacterium]